MPVLGKDSRLAAKKRTPKINRTNDQDKGLRRDERQRKAVKTYPYSYAGGGDTSWRPRNSPGYAAPRSEENQNPAALFRQICDHVRKLVAARIVGAWRARAVCVCVCVCLSLSLSLCVRARVRVWSWAHLLLPTQAWTSWPSLRAT